MNDRYLVKAFLNDSAPSITAQLNELAKDGWRLIYVVDEFHYFERKPDMIITVDGEYDKAFDRWLHAMDHYEDALSPDQLDF